MKIKSALYIVLLFGLLLPLLLNCKKEAVKVIPTVSVSAITNITTSTATSEGTVISDGGSAITARGVCWSTVTAPRTIDNKITNGKGIGSFTSNITGLLENTTYYLRAYATNSAGTGYGSEVSFVTDCTNCIKFNTNLSYSTLVDVDGNVYKTIQIGTQTWMAENLKATKYRNGDPIPNVTDNGTWLYLKTAGYCWYNNDETANKAIYGALYNWYAVTDIRNIAPTGWHVPTDAEWTTLTTFLGGENLAGGKLKETGLTHWNEPNAGATNSSGFTALPGGLRYNQGNNLFDSYAYIGNWWSSTGKSPKNDFNRGLLYGSNSIYKLSSETNCGFYVRCLRD